MFSHVQQCACYKRVRSSSNLCLHEISLSVNYSYVSGTRCALLTGLACDFRYTHTSFHSSGGILCSLVRTAYIRSSHTPSTVCTTSQTADHMTQQAFSMFLRARRAFPSVPPVRWPIHTNIRRRRRQVALSTLVQQYKYVLSTTCSTLSTQYSVHSLLSTDGAAEFQNQFLVFGLPNRNKHSQPAAPPLTS